MSVKTSAKEATWRLPALYLGVENDAFVFWSLRFVSQSMVPSVILVYSGTQI